MGVLPCARMEPPQISRGEEEVSIGRKESNRERKREREKGREIHVEKMLGSHLTVVEYADTM